MDNTQAKFLFGALIGSILLYALIEGVARDAVRRDKCTSIGELYVEINETPYCVEPLNLRSIN